MNTFSYRTPPVAASVVFAVKRLNIQCFNDKFGYNQKCHGNTVIKSK